MYDKDLLNAVKTLVSTSIRTNTVRGYIGWHSCDNICMDMNSILEEAKQNLTTGDAMTSLFIRYQLHRHLRGKESVRDELYANIDIDELRRIAINDALETKNYAEAERLCFEKASDDTWRYRASDPADWNNILFSIYERAGIKEKLISQARKLMLFGNVRFWGVLKDIYTKDEVWNDKRDRLLKDASTCRIKSAYYQILQDEQEWELLLKEMKQEPGEIFAYGSRLVKEYPEEVYSLCIEKIRDEASHSTERRMYKQVGKLISQLIKWGGVIPAEQLITELKTKYARRPAFIDELSNVERKKF